MLHANESTSADAPEEQHQGHEEGPEVVVLVDGMLSVLVKRQIPKQLHTHTHTHTPSKARRFIYKLRPENLQCFSSVFMLEHSSKVKRTRRSYLHANNGVDKEEHGDEQAHVWQGLPQRKKRGNIRAVYVHRTSRSEFRKSSIP